MFQANLIFGDQKMGDLIQVGMDSKEAKQWFGNTPPDLTLLRQALEGQTGFTLI